MYYSLIIVIPAIIFTVFYCDKRSKKKTSGISIEIGKEVDEETIHEEIKEVIKPKRYVRTSHDLSKQCIHLLGNFLVTDKNGNDISGLFTPKLRLLLTMLILSSEENLNGICGDTIVERLWKGKNKYAARNNRNVSLTKLRGILKEVGDIEILNEDNYWKIVFGEDVLCDYCEAITYYQAIKENRLNDEFHLNIFLELLSRGYLLHRTNLEWLNPYKARFAYQIIELLSSLLKDPTITDINFRIKIAQTLLRHDYINEEANRVLCILLNELGDTEQMNAQYNGFRTTYANLLGIQYEKTLEEILRSNL